MRFVAGQHQGMVTSCSASSSLRCLSHFERQGMALLLSSQRSGRMSSESGTPGGEGLVPIQSVFLLFESSSSFAPFPPCPETFLPAQFSSLSPLCNLYPSWRQDPRSESCSSTSPSCGEPPHIFGPSSFAKRAVLWFCKTVKSLTVRPATGEAGRARDAQAQCRRLDFAAFPLPA